MPEIPLSQQLSLRQIPIGWPRVLFVLVLVLVIVVIAAQLLIASYERVLAGRSQDLDRELQDLAGVIPSSDLARLTKLDQQIKNLRKLLASHVYLSRFLDELERLTLPQVRYVIVNINRTKSLVSIRGLAPSMDAVGLQAASFAQSPSIASVIVKSASISTGRGVLFDLDITFVPSLIQSAAQ
jgi:hypothetical protein